MKKVRVRKKEKAMEEEEEMSRGGRTSIVDEEVEDAPPAYCVE